MKKYLFHVFAVILSILLCSALSGAAEKSEPRETIDISGHPYTGPDNAPVTLVVFSDYL